MTVRPRCVVDTNVLVSALLLPGSVPRRALDAVLRIGVSLYSEATIRELAEVLRRPKFDPYVTEQERNAFLRHFVRQCEFVEVTGSVTASNDPTDDKFLELAVSGSADYVVTGDRGLLMLNPFQGIAIVDPADFVRALEGG